MKKTRLKCSACGRLRYRSRMEKYGELWWCRDVITCEAFTTMKKKLRLKFK